MAMTLVPSYGRDYKSKAAVQADWDAGKDFTIADFSSPHDGRQINLQDAQREGGTFNIRYKRLANIKFAAHWLNVGSRKPTCGRWHSIGNCLSGTNRRHHVYPAASPTEKRSHLHGCG